MIATVENLDSYFDNLFSSYPDFIDADRSYLTEEMNALQQLYFEKLMPEKATLTVACPSDRIIDLKKLTPPANCVLSMEDVISVYIGKTELPLLKFADFERRIAPCCSLLSEKLYLNVPQRPEDYTVKILFRCRPKSIHLDVGGVVGSLCIPEKHLPMVACKMRECMSRAVGENEDADRWAKAFNEWLTVLENDTGAGRKYFRATL